MGKTTLTWNYDGLVGDGFRIYRADSPMDPENLPLPIATVGVGVREYVDETVIDDATYYYRIASYVGGTERISEEIEHIAEDAGDLYWDQVVSLLYFDGDLTDEKGHIWTQSASGVSFGDDGSGIPKYVDLATSSSAQRTVSMVLPSTLEFTWRPLGLAGSGYTSDIIGFGTTTNCTDGFYLMQHGYSTGSQIRIGNGYSQHYQIGTGYIISGLVDHHIALQFNLNGSISVFINGVLIGTETRISSHIGATKPLALNNSSRSGSVQRKGSRFKNLRFTAGVLRYAGDFEPPTEPFPNF